MQKLLAYIIHSKPRKRSDTITWVMNMLDNVETRVTELTLWQQVDPTNEEEFSYYSHITT